ncbi:MAG: TolC family protein [Gemmatimonadota bacterium]|nr:TolC family protein [Gemmatimonadota bacterium]
MRWTTCLPPRRTAAWASGTRGAAVLLAAALGHAIPLTAQTDTIRLADAVALARSGNPALAAARLSADVAAERVGPAGAWMDPMLSFGLMNRPVTDFGTGEPMTMNTIELTQRFPWPGQLGFRRQQARYLAEAAALDADETERQLEARVKQAYHQLAYMDRALDVMRDTRELLRSFLDVSATRYAVGQGLQQDVLQAQIAVARMTADITVMEQDRVAMGARLNALLGLAARAPVPALQLPPSGPSVPEVDSLMTLAVRSRPALHAARARVEAAAAGYRQARRELYPEFMLGLAYGQRPQFDDMASIMVGVSIPLFAGARQLPMRREMAAMQAHEEAMERDLTNETFAEITELRAEAERARNLAELYANAVVPQARAAVESALAAYRVGSVDYMTLVENEMTVNRYRVESIRLTADYHGAIAALEALVAVDLGGTP